MDMFAAQAPLPNVASDPEYKAMFGAGTAGTLALYQHHHDHDHDHSHEEVEHNA